MTGSPSLEHVRGVLVQAFTLGGGTSSAAVDEQISGLRSVGGPITMLHLDVPSDATKIDLPDGPYVGSAEGLRIEVVNEAGDSVGGLVVWIEHGLLTSLEYFWYTDEPPLELPPISRIVGAQLSP